jgi:hypothetical protein
MTNVAPERSIVEAASDRGTPAHIDTSSLTGRDSQASSAAAHAAARDNAEKAAAHVLPSLQITGDGHSAGTGPNPGPHPALVGDTAGRSAISGAGEHAKQPPTGLDANGNRTGERGNQTLNNIVGATMLLGNPGLGFGVALASGAGLAGRAIGQNLSANHH